MRAVVDAIPGARSNNMCIHTERLTRKERKATLAEQLLADQELTAARTKRFAKMQEEASHWSLRKNKRQRQAEPARKHRARSKH